MTLSPSTNTLSLIQYPQPHPPSTSPPFLCVTLPFSSWYQSLLSISYLLPFHPSASSQIYSSIPLSPNPPIITPPHFFVSFYLFPHDARLSFQPHIRFLFISQNPLKFIQVSPCPPTPPIITPHPFLCVTLPFSSWCQSLLSISYLLPFHPSASSHICSWCPVSPCQHPLLSVSWSHRILSVVVLIHHWPNTNRTRK